MPSGIIRPLLYQSVIEEIYKLIDERQMKPGEQFPTERELVSKWNVSQSVLREAFHMLEVQGIVSSHQGKGRFLRNLPQDAGTPEESTSRTVARYSLLDLYEVRQTLEMKVISLIVTTASEAEIQQLRKKYNETCARYYRQGNTVGENDLHRMYASLSHNAYLTNIVDELIDITNNLMKQTLFYMVRLHTIEQYIQDHKLIIEAIEERNEALASQRMHDHLQTTIDIIRNR